MKSVDTTSCSLKASTPFMAPSAASRIFLQMSSIDAPLPSLTVRSTTETSGVGTRKDIPVSFPFKDGMTFPTALAAPVEEGDDVLRSTPTSSPVLATTGRPIVCELCCRHRMDGRHEALLNDEAIMDNFGQRSEAVRGAFPKILLSSSGTHRARPYLNMLKSKKQL